jgi:hypothetical protein
LTDIFLKILSRSCSREIDKPIDVFVSTDRHGDHVNPPVEEGDIHHPTAGYQGELLPIG